MKLIKIIAIIHLYLVRKLNYSKSLVSKKGKALKLAFISDLHLSPEEPSKNKLLINLLNQWQNELDGLYILGDFFDYYLGDDDNNPFMLSIKEAFSKFTTTTPIYFLGGNHDFGIGKKFVKETKIQLIKDLSVITVLDNNILLSHGDTFCTLDTKYQRMKKILQNPLILFILRKTPLSWRYKLKEKLEHESTVVFNNQPQETYNVVDSTIIRIAREKNTNIVIHGHTHNPGKYLINSGNQTIERFEIPDWMDNTPGGYILLEDNSINIHMPS